MNSLFSKCFLAAAASALGAAPNMEDADIYIAALQSALSMELKTTWPDIFVRAEYQAGRLRIIGDQTAEKTGDAVYCDYVYDDPGWTLLSAGPVQADV